MLSRIAPTVLLFLAAILARLLSRPSCYPVHRPVALALGATAAANLLRPALAAVGAPLALDRALYLVFPALSAALALEVLVLRWSPWAPVGRGALAVTWAAAVVAVALVDPPRAAPELGAFMFAAHVVALVVQAVAVAVLLFRGDLPDVSQMVVLLLFAGDAAEHLGAWLYDVPARDWDLARWQWTVVYALVCYVQGRRLRWWEATIHAVGRGSGSSPLVRRRRSRASS